MPSKIENVFDQPKVFEQIQVIGEGAVLNQIEFELECLADLMSVGGNLKPAQISFIAKQLIELHPSESIADFKLCFQRGAMGAYGEIQRMDGITLGIWMRGYLDEKYEVLERQLMAEKESFYRPVKTDADYDADKHSSWLKKLAEACGEGHKVPGMTPEEIKINGKEDPKKKRSVTAGYTYFNVRGVQIYASTQEHAEELVQHLIKNGDLIE